MALLYPRLCALWGSSSFSGWQGWSGAAGSRTPSAAGPSRDKARRWGCDASPALWLRVAAPTVPSSLCPAALAADWPEVTVAASDRGLWGVCITGVPVCV